MVRVLSNSSDLINDLESPCPACLTEEKAKDQSKERPRWKATLSQMSLGRTLVDSKDEKGLSLSIVNTPL